MTISEFKTALKTAQTWDEQMILLGQMWKVALKKYKDDPDRLHYSWEDLMSAYEEATQERK